MIRPLRDNIVIKQHEAEETKIGSIVLATTNKVKPNKGEVVAVGGGVYNNGHIVRNDVEVGDIVLFANYAGINIKEDNEEYVIVSNSDILAKL